MVAQPPPGGKLSDAEVRQLRELLARYAAHDLDQWELWKADTPHGLVYIEIDRELREGASSTAYVQVWPET